MEALRKVKIGLALVFLGLAFGIGMGISLGLIILIMFSDLKGRLKTVSSVLIGLGSFYPLAWFSMFLLAPAIGRDPAHHHYLTELFTYLGVGGLLSGIVILASNLFLGLFREKTNIK